MVRQTFLVTSRVGEERGVFEASTPDEALQMLFEEAGIPMKLSGSGRLDFTPEQVALYGPRDEWEVRPCQGDKMETS